jgi:hypothetical protein
MQVLAQSLTMSASVFRFPMDHMYHTLEAISQSSPLIEMHSMGIGTTTPDRDGSSCRLSALFQEKNLLEAILLIHYRDFEIISRHTSKSAVHEGQENGKREWNNEISQQQMQGPAWL